MRSYKFAPWPSINFDRQVADVVLPPLMGFVSGEVSASKPGLPLGVARCTGKVVGVTFSVLSAGKNNTSVPTGTATVYVNGAAVCSTNPSIVHVSGETAQQKTTASSAGDTGVTEAVIDHTANSFSVGDVFTWDFTYVGSTSPTTKMNTPSIIVELDPHIEF